MKDLINKIILIDGAPSLVQLFSSSLCRLGSPA